MVAETKKKIKNTFKNEMGLLVKAGFGNNNDRSTSRRFFSDRQTSSRITDVDIRLIEICNIILESLSSEHKIDA